MSTSSTYPMGLPDAAPTTAQAPVKAAPVRFKIPVSFTGSGSEYFRIWIVNLLLTIVTLGLYHPWAKVRRLRYFYGNTHIGDHTLDFHGNPTRMLRGFLLLGALLLLYTVAGKVSPTAGLIAFVLWIGLALWLFALAAITAVLLLAAQDRTDCEPNWIDALKRRLGALAAALKI